MDKTFKNYQVIETDGMSAEGLQKLLNKATDSFPEKQIEHVIGTKIILSYESLFSEKGRTENALNAISESIHQSAGIPAKAFYKELLISSPIKRGRRRLTCR